MTRNLYYVVCFDCALQWAIVLTVVVLNDEQLSCHVWVDGDGPRKCMTIVVLCGTIIVIILIFVTTTHVYRTQCHTI